MLETERRVRLQVGDERVDVGVGADAAEWVLRIAPVAADILAVACC